MAFLLEITPLLAQAATDTAAPADPGSQLTQIIPGAPDRYNVFSLISIFVGLVALGAYANARFLKLPRAVGTMVSGIVFALVLISLGDLELVKISSVKQQLDQYSSDLVLSLLLGLLLFAGAMQLDSKLVRKYRWSITYAATLGTAISIAITACLVYWSMNWLNAVTPHDWNLAVDWGLSFLFAAIIAPTDPVAVMSILRRLKVKGAIKAYISGESLFNDATSIVFFLLILQFWATGNSDGGTAATVDPSAARIALEFIWIAGGAVLLGLITGYLGAYLVKTTEKKSLTVLLTLGIALGTGGVADALGISNAVAVTIAGIVFGQRRADYIDSMDRPIHEFWKTVDNVVNPLFFALIGLELLVVQWNVQVAVAAVVVFPVVICARYTSLLIPWLARLGRNRMLKINHAGLVLMTWAGIRGGVSFALALSIPPYITYADKNQAPLRPDFLLGTFIVVVLSVVIQGLTTEPIARKLSKRLDPSN
ncbi:MAG: sodium:proton antiporter [Planctomycetota bacterium]|nr:sodium:proton antiporter [Planctomycetota bacterium]